MFCMGDERNVVGDNYEFDVDNQLQVVGRNLYGAVPVDNLLPAIRIPTPPVPGRRGVRSPKVSQ